MVRKVAQPAKQHPPRITQTRSIASTLTRLWNLASPPSRRPGHLLQCQGDSSTVNSVAAHDTLSSEDEVSMDGSDPVTAQEFHDQLNLIRQEMQDQQQAILDQFRKLTINNPTLPSTTVATTTLGSSTSTSSQAQQIPPPPVTNISQPTSNYPGTPPTSTTAGPSVKVDTNASDFFAKLRDGLDATLHGLLPTALITQQLREIPLFDGVNVDSWLRTIDFKQELNEWDDETTTNMAIRRMLPETLSELAQVISLRHANATPWPELRERIQDLFRKTTLPGVALKEIEEVRQGEHEAVADYAKRLKVAMGCYRDGFSQKMQIDKLINQSKHQLMTQYYLTYGAQSAPSWVEAVQRLQRIEQILALTAPPKSSGSDGSSAGAVSKAPRNFRPNWRGTSNYPGNYQNFYRYQGYQQQRFPTPRYQGPRYYPQVPSMAQPAKPDTSAQPTQSQVVTGNTPASAPRLCFTCNEPGHTYRNCPNAAPVVPSTTQSSSTSQVPRS